MSENPLISIITPLYNQVDLTRAYVQSLERTCASVPYELILVDNASTDGTAAYLDTIEHRHRVVRMDNNVGYARANNFGARMARAPVLGLLNNDLLLLEGWLQPMLDIFTLRDRVGLVGNVQLNARTGRVDHAGFVFSREGVGVHYGRDYPQWLLRARASFAAVTAACCLVRRETFLEFDGFDEGYVNGYEDVDLCLRLGERGYRHYVAASSVVYHHVSASRGRKKREDVNRTRFLHRWGRLTRSLGERQWAASYLLQHWRMPWRLNARKSFDALTAICGWMRREAGGSAVLFMTGTPGDAIVSLPLVRALRSRYPRTRWCLLHEQHGSRPTPRDVLEPLALVEQSVCLSGKDGRVSSWALLSRLTALRESGVQSGLLITSLTRSRRTLLLWRWVFRLAGLRVLGGFVLWPKSLTLPRDDEGRALPTDDELSWRMRRLEWQEESGVIHALYPWQLPEAAYTRMEKRLERFIPTSSDFIAVSAISGMPSKNWPLERWAALLRNVQESTGLPLLLLGGSADAPRLASLTEKHPQMHLLAGELDVIEALACVTRARAYIGLDSALSHAAVAAQTPSLVLFSGQSHPGLWKPRGSGHLRILESPVVCAGCLLRECPYPDHPCMLGIRTEEALEAFTELWESARREDASVLGAKCS